MLLSYNFIIFAKNTYTMSKLKYIPTDYSSSQGAVETPWSVNPTLIILGTCLVTNAYIIGVFARKKVSILVGLF